MDGAAKSWIWTALAFQDIKLRYRGSVLGPFWLTPSTVIMLMDEWLSAGDDRFLEKARKRMAELVGGSNIMVLASHSMSLLREWCNRGIFLEQGRVVVNGGIEEAIAAYQTSPAARQMASRRR